VIAVLNIAASPREFSLIKDLISDFLTQFSFSRIAVAVSGGPDSLALWSVLSEGFDGELHALHVDHGLRDESADEAAALVEIIPDVKILKWDAPSQGSVKSRLQEEARRARYGLMAAYCAEHGIEHLFLAHHRDDQAETVLFRFAKGSGLDGLGGMRAVQPYDEGLTQLRPFLDVPKADLVAYCEEKGLDYFSDPSNENDDFARVRLRQSRAILEEEGLSAKRLAVSAKRFQRARDALDAMTERAFEESVRDSDTTRVELDKETLLAYPEEIVLRVILRVLSEIGLEKDYAPRLERVEDLVADLIRSDAFRKRTLGGVVFERDDDAGLISCLAE